MDEPVDSAGLGRCHALREALLRGSMVRMTSSPADPSTDQSVVSWIAYHAARAPEHVALIDSHRSRETTYGELAVRVRALARSMAEDIGVGSGDRVAVLSRNDTRVFEVLYACALLGAVCVPLNWRLSPTELGGIVADAAPRMLVHESWAGPTAVQLTGLLPGDAPRLVAWASDDDETDDYEILAQQVVPPDWAPPPVPEHALWTIIYTSGTTGVPKGVQTTHAGALAGMLGILVAHGVDASSRCLTVLPTFHVAGLNLHANPVLFAGGTVVVARTFEPAGVLQQLVDPHRPITHFCGVPANYQFLQQLPEFADAPLRPFVAVVGGSPVPSALVAAWAERGVALTTVFGITEAGACVSTMPPGRELDHNGTIGKPVLYAQCRIQTVEGGAAAIGETGELQIAGRVVTTGYWRKPEATAAAFTADGWLRTGDAARLTDDGHLVLVDRWKDMYISGGENVYPAEVENVLHAHDQVSQTAVVGVPHPRWGETGVAFVVPARGAAPTAEDLVAWCRDHLAPYKVPAHVILLAELPRNATGKVLKAPLRDEAATIAACG